MVVHHAVNCEKVLIGLFITLDDLVENFFTCFYFINTD